MSAILLAAPAAEPLTLAEAKDFLRVEHDDEDELIAALIKGARGHIEAQTRRALITQRWRLVRDAWPPGERLEVLPAPLRALVAARVHGADGSTQAVELAAFAVDAASAPAVLSFAPGAMPVPGRAVAGIEIDIEVGYGAAAADVPEPLRQAVRLLVAHWYENRHIVAASGEMALTPTSVSLVLAPFRVRSL